MITLAAQDAPRGWGGPIALLVAAAIFVAYATLLDAWQRRREVHSPTEGDAPGVRVTPQARSVSDTDDTEPDTGWWGRIVVRNGKRIRASGPAVEVVDEELDLALEETLEDAIARMEDEGVAYMEIVRQVMDEHRVSESTAKRAIREVRAERTQAA